MAVSIHRSRSQLVLAWPLHPVHAGYSLACLAANIRRRWARATRCACTHACCCRAMAWSDVDRDAGAANEARAWSSSFWYAGRSRSLRVGADAVAGDGKGSCGTPRGHGGNVPTNGETSSAVKTRPVPHSMGVSIMINSNNPLLDVCPACGSDADEPHAAARAGINSASVTNGEVATTPLILTCAMYRLVADAL
jgi:hypothetical protein